MRYGALLFAALLCIFGVSSGCSAFTRSEGIDRSTLPDAVRSDYDLFAIRCSKCHSLSRPLSAGITDDDYWAMYVARMRRQPGSGISLEDTVVILRFLHYFSEEQLRKKEKSDAAPPAASIPAPPAASAQPSPPPAPPASAIPHGGTGAIHGARGRVF